MSDLLLRAALAHEALAHGRPPAERQAIARDVLALLLAAERRRSS